MTDIAKPTRDSKAGAGVAGIGTGTGLIALAQSLPDTSPLKPWLMFAAPTVSVTATALWLWAQVEIANIVQDWKIKMLARRLRQYLKDAIVAPTADPNHKSALQEKLREVDLIIANRDLDRLKSMAPISVKDVKDSAVTS